ncbi:MAG: S41 family peptidase [Firmicutes bacterium]|nr:S41 family peptidase [Bacillota bacterium]
MVIKIKRPVNRLFPLVLILFLLTVSFGLGFASVQGKFGDLVLAGQIIPLLKFKYYRPLRLSRLLLTYWQTGSVPALLASLNDPYTRYLTPEEYNQLLEENKGVYGGVGLYLEYKEEQLVIYRVMKNSPAARAGLAPGDRIIAIDRKSTAGMTRESVAAAILGPPGTIVFLTIQRGEGPLQTTREIALVRTLIDPSIEWEIRWDQDVGKIGWVTLTQFTEETGADLGRALQLFAEEKVAGVILDLRYNPGGLLVSALEVASRLLPGAKGHPLVSLEYRNRKTETFPAWANPHPTFPLVVLVNEWSASSAEIVAAAVKDLKAGVLVGNTTFGKGLVQDVIPLRGGGALYFTVARYLTAGGYSIHQTGVEPDVRVTLPANPAALGPPDPAFLQQVDRRQAETALQVLKELIRAHRKAAA